MKAFQQQQQLLEGPLLKCFSSSLPPVISPISCFQQLIASQGPWHVTDALLFLALPLCLHPGPGPLFLYALFIQSSVPNLSLYFTGPSVSGLMAVPAHLSFDY